MNNQRNQPLKTLIFDFQPKKRKKNHEVGLVAWFVWAVLLRVGGLPDFPEHDLSGLDCLPDLPE